MCVGQCNMPESASGLEFRYTKPQLHYNWLVGMTRVSKVEVDTRKQRELFQCVGLISSTKHTVFICFRAFCARSSIRFKCHPIRANECTYVLFSPFYSIARSLIIFSLTP